MRIGGVFLASAVAVSLIACGRTNQPLPAVDPAVYQAEHAEWRAEQQQIVAEVLPIVGVWPLNEGDTAFGSDPSLPIVLPSADVPARAGVFRRKGTVIEVVPENKIDLQLADGTKIQGATEIHDDIAIGSLRLYVGDAGDDRRWVTARDQSHPAVQSAPDVESYPLDPKWRVAARFEAFDMPQAVVVPDVRGGSMSFLALGQLVLRLNGHEERLTALGEPGGGRFFVMFRDPTNLSTTYSGYRIVTPEVVGDGEWAVLDFNFAGNPPCAYSRFTLCPLPPPENQLPVAIEAGLKRLPSARGYSPS